MSNEYLLLWIYIGGVLVTALGFSVHRYWLDEKADLIETVMVAIMLSAIWPVSIFHWAIVGLTQLIVHWLKK